MLARHHLRRAAVVASVAPLLAAGAASAAAAAGPSGRPAPAPAAWSAAPSRSVQVKFTEGSGLRVRGDDLRAGDPDERAAVEAVLERHGAARLAPLFARDEAALARDEDRLEARSGRRLEDLRLHSTLEVPAAAAAKLVAQLERLEVVESARVEPRPAPAPGSPDLTSAQRYVGAAPEGLATSAVTTVPGAQGEHVTIADIEYAWNRRHEDATRLAASDALLENGTPSDPFGDTQHGTATTAILGGDPNGFGVTGLAPGATLRMVNAFNAERGWDVANAIELARTRLSPGDVIVLEQQVAGPDGRYVPIEWLPSVYDAIAYATAAGIVVVQAAGNGGADLDAPVYDGAFSHGRSSSGAIVVGAGGVPGCSTPRARLGFSSYGTRVDLQGWGECVTTAGYGDQGGSDPNAYYTGNFGGTSSATAVVAAAAAAYSSAVEARRGTPPTPTEVRRALVESGTPQDTSTDGALSGHIGPLPNLAAALAPLGEPDAGAPPSGNRVANPSFEEDFAGWGSWQGALSRAELANAPSGSSVARVERTAGTSYSIDDSWAGARPAIAATRDGESYSASAWVRAASPSATGKTIRLILRERTPAGATVAETAYTTTLGTGFRRLAVVARARAAGNTLGVRLEQRGAVAGDAFHVDAITLAEGSLVRNGSFEEDVAGWGTWQATAARVPSSAAPGGAAVARVTRTSGTSFSLDDAWGGATATVSSTAAGATYVAGAHVRAAGPASIGRPLRIYLRERTPAGATVRETVASVTLTNGFQRIAVAAEATGDGNRLGVRFDQAGAVTGSAFEVDQVTLGAT